jgi:hypothetical protein
MSYVKMAKELQEAASTGKTMRCTTENAQNKINEFVNKDNVSMQDLVLAVGYAVHYCDYEAALPAQLTLMLALERMTSSAKKNPDSAYIAGSSISENLKYVRDAMKDVMKLDGTPAIQKAGIVARAVYDAPSDGAQAAILTVAEELSRSWDKDRPLDVTMKTPITFVVDQSTSVWTNSDVEAGETSNITRDFESKRFSPDELLEYINEEKLWDVAGESKHTLDTRLLAAGNPDSEAGTQTIKKLSCLMVLDAKGVKMDESKAAKLWNRLVDKAAYVSLEAEEGLAR